MNDFWQASGYHLLDHDPRGRLVLTDDFLRAYLMRPEMAPVEESCAVEVALHEALMAEPRLAVPTQQLASVIDGDARENYDLLLRFRDRLMAAATLEDAYLSLFLSGPVAVPPLFIDQLAQVILRGILDRASDGLRVRAGELLFREQAVTVEGGTVRVADGETVDMHATTGGFGSLGRLIADTGTPLRTIELDVLDEANADLYWARDERHDTVLDITFARPGADALCRVLESWIRHFLDVATTISPVQQITDERWVWHVGLDTEATAILNDLYAQRDVDQERLARILGLFRLDFDDPRVMRPDIAGRPVYLALAMTPAGRLRVKPQNLLVNLPLAARA